MKIATLLPNGIFCTVQKCAAYIAGVLAAYDFGKFDTIADIRGGNGDLLRAVLDSVPSAEGILFDPLPIADAYILVEVLHDWGNAESAAILKAIHRAASPGRGHTFDVVMVAVTGGRERTGEQLSTLLRGAGFTKPTVIDTAGPMRIVEAIAG